MSHQYCWILLAAGASRRFGTGRSKLIEEVEGKRIIDITLESIETALPSSEVILVSTPELKDELEYQGRWTQGGERRQDSAYNGILAADDAEILLIHDAARPFIHPEAVSLLLAALEDFDGVAPAVPVTDTIKKIQGATIIETLERSSLAALQTPQALAGPAARDAFSKAGGQGSRDFTDDLSILEAAGYRTGIVEGRRDNIKITTREDLVTASEIFNSRAVKR